MTSPSLSRLSRILPVVFAALLTLSLNALAVPTVTTLNPAANATLNSFTSITVTFSEAVVGVDAQDLIVAGNGAEAVVQVDGPGTTWQFLFTQPPAGTVVLYWDIDHAITNQGGAAFVPTGSWTYTLTDTVAPVTTVQNPLPGLTLNRLTQCEVTFSEAVTGVDAADLLVNGAAVCTSVAGSGSGPYVFTFPQPANGAVAFQWTAGHGITDLASPPNAFAGGTWSVTMNSAQAVGNVVMNEIMAFNVSLAGKSTALADEDGTFSPWIELYNRGASSVNLAGWSLSDSANDPGQWVFPSGAQSVLGAGQYLVIWCDGKDRKTPAGANRMHTNFGLKAGGKYLGLFSAELPRQAVHQFSPGYPVQRADVSYGYDSSNALKYFAGAFTSPATAGGPSFGTANGTSTTSGIAQPVTFSVNHGYFTTPFSLVLSTTTGGATIRYTTDGSVPTAGNGTVYAAPLTISATTALRAAAFATNMLGSEVSTQTYVYVASVLAQPAAPAGYPTTFSGYPANNVWTSTPATIQNGSRCYFQMDSTIAAADSTFIKAGLNTLPTIALTMPIADLFDQTNGIYSHPTVKGPTWERGCSMELLFPDGSEKDMQVDCGVQIQGGSSRSESKNMKHSFRLVFKDDFGTNSFKRQLFTDSPVTSFNTFDIDGGSNYTWDYVGGNAPTDQRQRAQFTRDAFTSDLLLAMGWPSFHSRYMNLYLNGLYWGLFYIHDRCDQAFAASYYGGDKSEYDALRLNSVTLEVETDTLGFQLASSYPSDTHLVAWNAMMALATSGLSSNAQYEQLGQYLDVTAFCDYMIAQLYAGNDDWPQHNWYALRHRVPGGKFHFTIWDAEHTLKGATSYLKFDASDAGTPGQLWANLRLNAEFRLLFADRVQKHFFNGGVCFVDPMHTAYDPAHPEWDRPAALYMRRNNEINSAIAADSAKWGNYTTFYAETGAGTYTRANQWLTEQNNLLGLVTTSGYTNNYFPTRSANVLAQFQSRSLFPASTAGAPVFGKFGGRVPAGYSLTMALPSGTSGTIYYTTNGTDPRVYGSGLAATPANGGAAAVYSGALTLNASATIKARVLNGATWSAVTSADFTVGAPALQMRFTEIMYHPTGTSDYEFVELQNTGTVNVNLGGCYFDGVSFVFPPNTIVSAGQRIVLGSDGNIPAWQVRYPGVVASGYFNGSLDNAGERVALIDPTGRTICAVNYKPDSGWPTAADGAGYSLEVNDPLGDPDDPTNWHASAVVKGTPGAANSAAPSGSFELSEVMAYNVAAVNNGGTFPPWIELRNKNAGALDLAGWSVTNDGNPRKYTFPGGTTVPANGYYVIWCDSAATPGLHTGFTLSAAGDNVQLFDPSGTPVRMDAVQWGQQIADKTIGKIAGVWQLNNSTPNSANTAATLAPASDVALNEWLANPNPPGEDFIELFNKNATLPAALRGDFLQTNEDLFQVTALTFIPPRGWLALTADKNPGVSHVDFKLPLTGDTLALLDANGNALDTVTFGAQAAGVAQGRNPDGFATIVTLPIPTPGAANYVNSYTGPVINEVLAINAIGAQAPWGARPAWIEIFNASASSFDLSGMKLGTTNTAAGAWTFPSGSVVGASGYLSVWCDAGQPASASFSTDMNTGFTLGGASGGVYLFNAAGQIANSVEYGFQITDKSIGLSAAVMKLLANPTRAAANSAAATLGAVTALRFNEWMAQQTSLTAPDWFELYNTDANPVAMGGLYLTDDPSSTGVTQFAIPALSFISGKGWVKWEADNDVGAGRNHVNFTLDGNGEYLLLSNNDVNLTQIDAVSFGLQTADVSQGRIPDGTANIVAMPGSPTPGAKNVLLPAPSFSTHPLSQTVMNGANVSFLVAASGSAPLTLQWKFNNVDIAGQTGTTLARNAVTAANDGVYTCVATNSAGSVSSSAATLIVQYTYAQWALLNNLGGASATTADPDGDGVRNLQEFFHNLNPQLAADFGALPQPALEPPTGTPLYLTLTYRRSARAVLTNVEHQLSLTLANGSWTTVPPDVTENLSPDPVTGDPRVRVKFSIAPGETAKFLRLLLTP